MYFDQIKNYKLGLVIALIVSVFGFAACAFSADTPNVQSQLPTVQIVVGAHSVTAELANTELSRKIGLMNRKEMPNNSGMLFVFKHSETQCMWMKNTLIDLDVAFADEAGRILNVEQMKAGTGNVHCSKGNAKLALEMNRNWFLEQGVGVGEVLKLPHTLNSEQ